MFISILIFLNSEAAVNVRFQTYDVGQETREVDLFVEKKVFGVGNVEGFNALEILMFRGFLRDVGNGLTYDVSTAYVFWNVRGDAGCSQFCIVDLLCVQRRDYLCGTFTTLDVVVQDRIMACATYSYGIDKFYIRPCWQMSAFDQLSRRLNDFYSGLTTGDWILHVPKEGNMCVVKTSTGNGFIWRRGRVIDVKRNPCTVRILIVDSGEELVNDLCIAWDVVCYV